MHNYVTLEPQGGSTGIGKSIAVECVKRGARVTLMARSEDKLVQACKEINTEKVNAQYQCADVTSISYLKSAFERAEEKFGPVDVLITSAGSAKPGYFLEQDVSIFERSIKLNYLGTVNAAKIAAYVFFYWISHSHLFNELDIHTTFMCTYIYPLSLVTHSLIHKLTQAIMHAYVTLDPQGRYHIRFGKSKVDR